MTLHKHSKRTLRTPCKKCGAKDLYWAHDTDRPAARCDECGGNGKFTLIEQDGSRHDCQRKEQPVTDPFAVQVSEEAPQPPQTVATPEPVSAPPADASNALAEALRAVVGAPAIDRAAVEAIAREILSDVVYPTKTVIVRDTETVEVEGTTHECLSDVVTALLSGEHVMMVGPAGTGKSTIAEQAAEALGLSSYGISLSPQTPASQIIGYMQATGDYVPTLFRKAYETGGVFHFDEVDNAHPSVLAVINGALANGHMAFPDGMIKRHEDFRAVASANTYGRGATRAYVGRQAIDAATLDRFTVLTVDIDEALETALARQTGVEASVATRVLEYVRKLRANAEKHGINVVISPRASVGMCRLLGAGMSWVAAVDARVRRGLDEATWNKLNG